MKEKNLSCTRRVVTQHVHRRSLTIARPMYGADKVWYICPTYQNELSSFINLTGLFYMFYAGFFLIHWTFRGTICERIVKTLIKHRVLDKMRTKLWCGSGRYCKQPGPRSVPTKCSSWSGSKHMKIWWYCWKFFWKTFILKKLSADN